MALDGLIIHSIVTRLQTVIPCKINRIHQVSDTEVLFQVRHDGNKLQLLISAHSAYNRLNLTTRNYPTPENPSNFIMTLRKHLEGGLIQQIEQTGLDRCVDFTIASVNDMGDPVRYHLYAELMGKYANLILVSPQNKIIHALKLIPPYENTRRIIQIGAEFELTKPLPGKTDPFTHHDFDPNIPLIKQFSGFSPLLENEVLYRLSKGEKFEQIMDQINKSQSLYLSVDEDNEYFHLIPLTYLNLPVHQYPIFEGLDEIYFSKEEHDRIRQQTGDLFKLVRKELKKLNSKVQKLNDALNNANASGPWKEKGELLYGNLDKLKKGMTSITLTSYETNQPVIIPLDPKLDGKGNAKKCFQKYTKGRNGKVFITEQLNLANDELSYFNDLEYQLSKANFNDAKEIQEELVANGYLSPKKKLIRRKKKDPIPAFQSFQTEDGAIICYGKNNLQNEYLTWKKANKKDLWFHVKDFTGSHVLLIKVDPSEEDIRLAAMVAAYHSSAKQSSSIPVNWCPGSNLKRIPKAKVGLVSLTNYKTIYIDIDPDKLKADPEIKDV